MNIIIRCNPSGAGGIENMTTRNSLQNAIQPSNTKRHQERDDKGKLQEVQRQKVTTKGDNND